MLRRIFGIETEYGLSTGQRGLSPEDLARELFRPVVEEYSSSNVFLRNASRLYLDVGAHPEIATAECDSLPQLIAHERAGDAVVDNLARRAEESLGTPIYLFKNNLDSVGNSYGCHENYLISRGTVLKTLGRQLLAFMVTRQIICGAGNIDGGFRFSQRAEQVWEGVSSATTRSRPIINTRDEPHADSTRYRRLHVIVGDSAMAEPTLALKVGSALLVLEMMEEGYPLPDWELADPIAAIRAVNKSARAPLTLTDGSTLTALELQSALCGAAEEWLGQRPEDQHLRAVVDLWQRTLEALETGDYSGIDREIDWAIKYSLLQRYRQRLDCGWEHPRLAQINLAYHDIRPGRGLARVLEAKGLIRRWSTEEEVRLAQDTPPQSTRAKLRGEFLSRARELEAPVTADWLRLKVNRPEPQFIELGDPFAAADPRVEELIAYMEEHHGHA
ncbi:MULTISPECIES: Pup--protein ligase [unclassified Corynebacterium]|uniref:Pup--protein ligase n=1 Tax=unclassified Corynebacterium TaxID=2624378 RepID=UPI0029C9E581|nr:MULTISPECIES: Pup--protein ligase [unclassified Corynebacterium]WPF67188.1 Pup--protein ligase [Corynebacterium sp. 22KM0430]WPF69677.1 Pup--protein ligase [Corynebacterium sp. 21KM1197]